MLIGAGTVMTPAQVAEIAAAGGRLIVTPHADVARGARGQGGTACSPAPASSRPPRRSPLLAAGADALKLFPAEAASPAVLRGMRAVLPAGTAVLPVGGIEAGNVRAWRAAGAAGSASARRSTGRATPRRRWPPRRRRWSPGCAG